MFKDLKAIKERDPAARNYFEIILTYASFHAVLWYRVAHFFYKIKLKLIARIISQLTRFFTQIEIHPGAKIGHGFFIDHGTGVVIGETAEIGNNVTIYQGVTLGGTGKDIGKRHPTICDNVMISAGAKVLGPFTVGEGSKIGAGSVVLKEVPPFSTVVGVPGRIVKVNGMKVGDMDQITPCDPVLEQLDMLKCRFEILERKTVGNKECDVKKDEILAQLQSLKAELELLKTKMPEEKANQLPREKLQIDSPYKKANETPPEKLQNDMTELKMKKEGEKTSE